MNKIIGIVLLASMYLGSLSVQAHPSDSDDFSSIGTGTKLIVTKDLNLIPNWDGISFAEGSIVKNIGITTGNALGCKIKLKEWTSYDRVIPKGTIYKITGIAANYVTNSAHVYEFMVDSKVIQVVRCIDFRDGPSSSMFIRDFKEVLGSYFQVDLASPVPVR